VSAFRLLEALFDTIRSCYVLRVPAPGELLRTDDLDNPAQISILQRGVHRELKRSVGGFGDWAIGFGFGEDIKDITNVDMHDFDV